MYCNKQSAEFVKKHFVKILEEVRFERSFTTAVYWPGDDSDRTFRLDLNVTKTWVLYSYTTQMVSIE